MGLRKHLVIGQLNEYQFFSVFHWSTSDTPPASQCITVQRPISKTLCGTCIAAIAGYLYTCCIVYTVFWASEKNLLAQQKKILFVVARQ